MKLSSRGRDRLLAGSTQDTFDDVCKSDVWDRGHAIACEQALCLAKKIAKKGKGKGRREPVDKHLGPPFRTLVIILPIICQ